MESNAAVGRHVIGVMTGTSIDGLDAALVRMTGEGGNLRVELVRHRSASLGPLAQRLRQAATQQPMTSGDLASLAWDFGLLHADVIDEFRSDGPAPDLIAVHGQTVFHQPPVSWQLVNPAPIASRFACPVVHDLRQADLAVGGQGAPITPGADWILFRDASKSRAIVNLGGFCNVSILPADTDAAKQRDVRGFDVCACNQILDAVARQALATPFDVNGQAAQAGKAHLDATEQLLTMLRRQRMAGRSLGTGDEAISWVGEHHGTMSGNDLAASAVAAVARCIGEAIAENAVDEVVLAGGGTKNAAMVAELAEATALPMCKIEQLGLPAEAREAVCIAVLGDQAFSSRCACSIAWPARS